MKKDLGIMPAVFPMPVLMVATYDEKHHVDVMNAGWGQMASADQIVLFISEGHKTTKNIRKTGAFTVSLADRKHMKEADYFVIASGNQIYDKFEKTGLHAHESTYVDVPVIDEFPVVMECELEEIIDDTVHAVVGRIVNVAADESVLGRNGKPDVQKMDALMVDTFQNDYYSIGKKEGSAFHEGTSYFRKK